MSSKYQPSRLALAIGSALAVSSTQAATITVTTLDDPGGDPDCSLRAAIESVNAQSAYDGCDAGDGVDDTIVFDSGLSGTIALAEGQLDVAADMSIEGPGAENLTIDAGENSRVFEVSGASATISGLTVTGGGAVDYAGGVYVIDDAEVSLNDCVITGNTADGLGGGIDVFGGTLEVGNCEISGNSAGYGGGGISVSSGTAVVSESTVSGNYAQEYGGGLWVSGNFSDGPYFNGGRRPGGRGGGYYGYSLLTIADDSLVTGNQAYGGGGVAAGIPGSGPGLQSIRTAWEDPEARAELLSRFARPDGAGLEGIGLPVEPNLVILDSTISENTAALGGGVLAASDPGGQGPNGDGGGPGGTSALQVERSTITNNESGIGGGVAAKYSSNYLLETGVTDNSAYKYGGGVANLGAPPGYGGPPASSVIVQSQISGNEVLGASDNRGGPFGDAGAGGGVLNVGAYSALEASDVSGNTAAYGGGMLNVSAQSYSYLSTLNANQGGGVMAKYGAQTVVFGSRVEENTGPWGGGMDCVDAGCAVAYSSVTGNEGGFVGGINAGLYDMNLAPNAARGLSPGVEVFSSTVSGNTGGVTGGVVSTGPMQLRYATVADNHQDSGLIGDSEPNWDGNGGGIVTGYESSVAHSIIADNTAESGPNDLYVSEDFAPDDEIAMNWSLVRDDSGFTPAGGDNIFDQDPLLGPLDFHGGSYSLVHSLLSGSPALDAGDPDVPDPPDYDQRGPGFDRIFNDRIDIGAFEGQEPAISLSVTSIDFGDVTIGANATADVTAESTGTAPLEIGTIEIVGAPAEFEIFDDNCSGVTLDPAQDCTFSVRFLPQAREIHSEIASVPSNAPDSPAEVELSGRGVAPELTVDPDPLDFGAVEIGTTSGVEFVELSNTGDAELNINGTAGLAAPFTANGGTCSIPGALMPGENCTLGYDFSPVAEGLVSRDIAVDSDSFGGDEGFTLQGTGFDTTPAIALSATSIDFDDVLVGGDDTSTLTIESVGAGPLTIGQIDFGAVTLGAGAEFEILNDVCSGAVLAPSEQCTLDIRFEPPARGTFEAALSIPSDAPDNPAQVALLGVGVAPELTIDPALVDFGDIEVDTTSPAVFVELSNSGSAVLNLADASAPAAPFAGAGGTCAIPGSLDVGESCTLGFTFSPTEAGAASQTVSIDSDSQDGDDAFTLQGNGTSEPPQEAVPIPAMSRLTTLLLGAGLLLLGLLGWRRRVN